LVELLDNALKFTDGDVVVTGRRGTGRTVEVVVRDRGPGLPDDVLLELGQGFRQGDGSATRRHGGLGLGLAMVQRIAAAMGGDVRCESPDGGGLAVVVRVRAVVR
jgi:signal transduction histidine kinase